MFMYHNSLCTVASYSPESLLVDTDNKIFAYYRAHSCKKGDYFQIVVFFIGTLISSRHKDTL